MQEIFLLDESVGGKIKSKTPYRPGLVIESQGRYEASKHKKLKREMLATITTNSCNLDRRVSGLEDLKIIIIIVGTYSFHYLHNYELDEIKFLKLVHKTFKVDVFREDHKNLQKPTLLYNDKTKSPFIFRSVLCTVFS